MNLAWGVELEIERPERAANSGWYALDVQLEGVGREAVEYALMEAGALGTETNTSADDLLLVTAYFNDVFNREVVRSELLAALQIYDVSSSAVREMEIRVVENHDWLEEWKKNW